MSSFSPSHFRQLGSALASFVLLAATLTTWQSSFTQAAPITQTQNYSCVSSPEYFTVPSDVYSLQFDMYGASDGWTSSYGARVTGTVSVTPGESLEIMVGCKGAVSDGSGGYPNGGRGGGI